MLTLRFMEAMRVPLSVRRWVADLMLNVECWRQRHRLDATCLAQRMGQVRWTPVGQVLLRLFWSSVQYAWDGRRMLVIQEGDSFPSWLDLGRGVRLGFRNPRYGWYGCTIRLDRSLSSKRFDSWQETKAWLKENHCS